MKKKSLRIETPERHLGAVDEMEEGYSPSPYPGTPYSQQSGFSATDHSEYDSEYDPENDDDLMSSALGSDYGDDDGGGGRDWIDPDVLYGDEFGYWVIKLLRGPSVGRRIKRCVFKIMLITFACNVALMVMAYLEDRMYAMSAYFSTSPYGATLQILMWLTCIPGIFMAVMSLLFLKYWSSIVTNRNLFSQMCRVYMVGYIVCLSLASWMMAVLLLMFEPVERWTDDMNLVQIFPFYLCTHIFTWPYLIVSFYYVMDISYWMDELVNANGEINEPDPPPNTIDLADVSLNQVILLVIAFPCMITVQLLDLIYALFKALSRYISIRRQQMADVAERKRTAKEEADEDARSGRSSVWDRAKRTAKRRLKQLCFCCCNSGGGSKMPKAGATTPVDQDFPEFPDSPMGSPQRGAAGGSALAGFGTPNRETQERLERERATEEQERRIAKKQAEIDAQVAEDAARAAEEKERLAALEAAEAKKREELEKETSKPFLEVSSFRTMWGTLANSGSFQCKLKSTPSLVALIDHLKRQGFHVVFAAQPKADEVEVGICNIRSDGQGPWFLARFLASSGSFSAVMKSEDPAATSKYVKKFALAKTLKIDTNHMRNTPVKSAGDGPIPGAK